MAKKISGIIAISLSILFLMSACSTTKVDEAAKENEKKVVVLPTDDLGKCKNFEEAGKLMMESVINGLSTENYDLYSRDFTEQNKKYFNEKVFQQAAEAVKKELGEYKSVIEHEKENNGYQYQSNGFDSLFLIFHQAP